MKFAVFPVEAAVGITLAHTIRTPVVLKKGHVLTAANLELLSAHGVSVVSGVKLDPDDVEENAAAARIATLLSGNFMEMSAAHTGRCNLVADVDGIFRVEKAAIDAANKISETITVATLPDFAPVRAGQIIATVKIIPFAVTSRVLAEVSECLSAGALGIRPFQPKIFSIISTTSPGLKPSVVSSTEEITRRRVAEVKGTVLTAVVVDHTPGAVAREIHTAINAGAHAILIAGATATVDRSDTVPAGIVSAGGVIEHFGMPVDPGNLLVLAHVGPHPVLVLPGCARSPKMNGADWVLQRVAAGIAVSSNDIMEMGVGGLLVDTPSRPLPRAQAVQDEVLTAKPDVVAILLAAGQSRRMGGLNKLLMDIDGEPLVRRVALAACSSPVSEVIVVLGHEADAVHDALRGLNVRFVENARYAEGLSTSLNAGLDAVPASASGALICLGDMPGIGPGHIARLIAGFNPSENREIGVPTSNGKRGNPVLWGRRFFQEMRALSGDVGAKHLIGVQAPFVYEVEFPDLEVLTDLDTPDDWGGYWIVRPHLRST